MIDDFFRRCALNESGHNCIKTDPCFTHSNHTISVHMIFRGHGYGIFSYLRGYKFTVRSSHTFTASEGRQNVITVRAYEKGNITTELKDRPAIKFEVNLYSTGKAKGGEK